MKTISSFLALLVLLVLAYSVGNLRSWSEVVHADQPPSSRWTKVEVPLTVRHEDRVGLAYAQGYWQATSLSKDKQLLSPIAVKIECNKLDKSCRESEATVFLGVLQADLLEYDITSWTTNGIVADDTDEGNCGIGHRLSLDFKSNSVTVTDYPKKVTTDKNCQAFQDADSYTLRGGQLVLYPPAPWDPLAKPEGTK
jgi:hypothetical protein